VRYRGVRRLLQHDRLLFTYVPNVISTGVGGLCVTDDPEYRHSAQPDEPRPGPIYTRIDDDQGLGASAYMK